MNAVILIACASVGQCSGPSCPAPAAAVRVYLRDDADEPRAKYWVNHQGKSILVLGFRMPNGRIRWYEHEQERDYMQTAREIPIPAAAAQEPKPVAILPPTEGRARSIDVRTEADFGVSPGMFASADKPATRATGRTAKEFVMEARQPDLPKDSKLHLTVIGSEQQQKTVMDDLRSNAELRSISDVEVQGYKPDHWAVAGLGFPAAGTPAIVIQDAGGKVLWRADSYAGGPGVLAEALRRANPDYKPELDPGPATGRKPKHGGGTPDTGGLNGWLVVAALAVMLLLPANPNRK